MAYEKNPLTRYFLHNRGRLIDKWMHYFDIYDRHFSPYRFRPITVVEFGVSHGGSLQMWKKYFGKRARLTGVDIDPRCANLGEERINIVIGDQSDREFLARLRDQVGPIDVLIDDGGHTMQQQIATFEVMWPAVKVGGVYLVEDLHTSYWDNFGGGYRRSGTFIEYAKALVDQQNAWYSRDDDELAVDGYSRTIAGMHVYDSVIVFDKGDVHPPVREMRGNASF
ncbi:MAG: class I SAM-dependent methyltransferase [Leifsonia sp.]